MKLRVVGDEKPPLSREELRERGNDLVTEARKAAISAIGKSMVPEFVARGRSLQRRDLLRWRSFATGARDEWQVVIDKITELLHEMDKTEGGTK